MSFKNGKNKAVTFSFDDGNLDDIRLVELLNKYGLKATFNLNAGAISGSSEWNYKTKTVRHINYFETKDLYKGHEIASHTYTHPDLTKCSEATIKNEIETDLLLLEYLYKQPIRGMALPFGTYNDTVLKIVESYGLTYCRSVVSTNTFALPNSLLLNPTCKFLAPNVSELADKFINEEANEPLLFYIWGHSYELMDENDWQTFEKLCQKLSGRDDIFYCTNIEAIEQY